MAGNVLNSLDGPAAQWPVGRGKRRRGPWLVARIARRSSYGKLAEDGVTRLPGERAHSSVAKRSPFGWTLSKVSRLNESTPAQWPPVWSPLSAVSGLWLALQY